MDLFSTGQCQAVIGPTYTCASELKLGILCFHVSAFLNDENKNRNKKKFEPLDRRVLNAIAANVKTLSV